MTDRLKTVYPPKTPFCGGYNKGADQLRGYREAVSFAVTAKLICVFVFAYAKCWFSHDVAHMSLLARKSIFTREKETICPKHWFQFDEN